MWAFEKILSSKSERGTFILSEYKSTRGETILILKKGEQMIKPNELFASSGLKLDQFNVMLYKLFILKNRGHEYNSIE